MMKNTRIIMLLMAFLAFTSCQKDGETRLRSKNIPTEINSYADEHFPNNPIKRVIRDRDDGWVTYDVFLKGNIDLEFNEKYEILEIDGRTELPKSVIPTPIWDYVETNYSNYYITDWKLEGGKQEIKLNNQMELVFDLEGTFLYEDRD